MHGLALVNEQLETIARHTDWSRHGEYMASVDAELAQLNQMITAIQSLHGLLVELDAICFRDIERGKLHPDPEVHKLLLTALSKFQTAGTVILQAAEAFALKGIPVPGVAALRKIAKNPGDGLYMTELAKAAQALDAGGAKPPEVPFDEKSFDRIAQAGKAYRHLGND